MRLAWSACRRKQHAQYIYQWIRHVSDLYGGVSGPEGIVEIKTYRYAIPKN
jgi:hypothetical protein